MDPELDVEEEMRAGRAVTISHAAEMLDVSRRTIYNWIETGKVRRIKVPSGASRILLRSLWRYPEGEK